jgi:TIR domain
VPETRSSCYARMDAEHVDVLQRKLEDVGVSVWRDTKDLWPGDDWRARIRQAIDRDAFVFIACFSEATLSRGESHQYDELLQAVDQLRERRLGDKWLFPVRLDDCEIPDYNLGGGRTLDWIQQADLFGDQRDQQADRLVEAVVRELARRGPQAQPDPRAAGGTSDSPAVDRGADTPAGRRRDRNRALLAIIALAVVVAVVIVVVVLVRLGGTPVTASPGVTAATASTSVTTAATASPGVTTAGAASPGASPVTARVFSAKSDKFDVPEEVAVAGGHVWVANFAGNSVTELIVLRHMRTDISFQGAKSEPVQAYHQRSTEP